MTSPPEDIKRIRGVRPPSRDHARQSRQTPTAAEVCLWNCLRDRQLAGLKFRRQHAVGPYILDFYCSTCKLTVEVDGGIHKALSEYDEARTAQLGKYGYRVIRFSNEEVLGDVDSVLRRTLEAAGAVSEE